MGILQARGVPSVFRFESGWYHRLAAEMNDLKTKIV
jgi:hypothetical protein